MNDFKSKRLQMTAGPPSTCEFWGLRHNFNAWTLAADSGRVTKRG